MIENGDSEGHPMFAMLLYTIWDSRNKLTFRDQSMSQLTGHQMAASKLEEFNKVVAGGRHLMTHKMNDQWHPLEVGFVKINTDASLIENKGSGLGVIIRDSRGQVLSSLMYKVNSNCAIKVAEAVACRARLKLAREMNFQKVYLETDNITLYHKLRKRAEDLSYMGNIVDDIYNLIPFFETVIPSFIRRSRNFLAHSS
ncbi:hypothetical protein DH2020_024722 [Rehmannia glutinosa]|uniref:RNase H type-1 domain-containing protein n=1 Tax=Rehmannia glutinosa TaxID=99300 RepID=A0ABR0W5J7_REHGL